MGPLGIKRPGRRRFLVQLPRPGIFRRGPARRIASWTRRLAFPTLVFNAHEQFEDLRRSGRFPAVQQTIRKRDTKLQGSPNPALAEYGRESEARQYAGRLVSQDWQCPFHQTGHQS
jgi:FPC/CPF motif-containing protein YcgG